MSEIIEVEYRAVIDGFKAQLKSAEDRLASVEKTAQNSAQKTQKHFESAGEGIKDIAKEIATSLGLAFGVEKVIEFGKECLKAFNEAEVSVNKLKFAVTKIGGEGESAFRKLIEQSEKLQKTTIFSNTSVQQSQTMLATLGLNSKQIEELIPKIADLASATSQDLGSATQSIIQGINGQSRGLKAVGLDFDATTDKTKNLSILTEKLTKFQGASAQALETSAGKAQRFDNAIESVKESIGKMIHEEGNGLLDFFDALGQGFDKVAMKNAKGIIAESLGKQNDKIIEEAGESEAKRQKLIEESNKKIGEISKRGLEEQDYTRKSFYQIQLQNEQKLNDELRNLNKERNGLGVDPAIAAAAKKAAEDAEKARLAALKDLLAFDKQVSDELLASEAQTELQKLELIRDNSLKELELKTEAARAAGVSEKQIVESNNKDIANIINRFNVDRSALELKNYNDSADKLNAAIDKDEAYKKKKKEEAIAKLLELQNSRAAFETTLGDPTLELNLLDNKYKKEQDKFKDNAKVLLELQNEYERNKEAILEKGEAQQRQIEQGLFQFISDGINAVNQIEQNKVATQIQGINDVHDESIRKLDDELATKEISQEEYNKKKMALDKKAHDEEAKLKKEAWESQKQASIISTLINTATAVVAQLANPTPYVGFVLAALAAATGAAQVAVIESQPTPKFAKGVVRFKGKGTGTSDENHVMISRGESVVIAEESMKYSGLLEAMNKKQTGKFIQEYYIAPALKAQKKKYDSDKESSFADNLMRSMTLNSGKLNDSNLLDSLKMSRRNDREIAQFMVKELKGNGFNPRKW